jgi:hypothetical protein
VPFLARAFGSERIIAQIADDSPAAAFNMLRLGVYAAVQARIGDSNELWALFNRVVADSSPYEPLFKETIARPQERWGFLSMAFLRSDGPDVPARFLADADYRQAIAPAMKRLGLGVHRADGGSDRMQMFWWPRVKRMIDAHPVFMALISCCTDNVKREIDYAESKRKPILLLKRQASDAGPDYDGADCCLYSSKTELAMMLFFGLGGTRVDLI